MVIRQGTLKRQWAGCLTVHRHWLLTPHRAAFHLPTATLVLSDLHLGYDQARRQGGEAVPKRGLIELTIRLERIIREYAPRRLVIAGDLVENRVGRHQAEALLAWLEPPRVRETIIVRGNHDRSRWIRALPNCAEQCTVGAWQVVHGDGELGDEKLILGHFHPCLRLENGITAPCYLVGRRRIVLPAFSDDARGMNVIGADPWRSFDCAAIVGHEVLDFGPIRRLMHAVRSC